MNIKFDKTYIISFVKNIEKQNSIKNTVENILHITNYEFIYGIDIYALAKTLYNPDKHNFYNNYNYNIHGLSDGIAHFTAMEHALANNYNRILLIEDDVQFINDIKYIEYILNNYPDDADIVKFSYVNMFETEKHNYNDIFYKGIIAPGTQCYGLCNKQTINNIYNNYKENFRVPDSDQILKNTYNNYSVKYVIGVDPAYKIDSIDHFNEYPSNILNI